MASTDKQNKTEIYSSIELWSLKLKACEFQVYARIAMRAGGLEGKCWESNPKMAKACNMSPRNLVYCLRILEAMKMIEPLPTNPGESTAYKLTLRSQWLEPSELPKIRKLIKKTTANNAPLQKTNTPANIATGNAYFATGNANSAVPPANIATNLKKLTNTFNGNIDLQDPDLPIQEDPIRENFSQNFSEPEGMNPDETRKPEHLQQVFPNEGFDPELPTEEIQESVTQETSREAETQSPVFFLAVNPKSQNQDSEQTRASEDPPIPLHPPMRSHYDYESNESQHKTQPIDNTTECSTHTTAANTPQKSPTTKTTSERTAKSPIASSGGKKGTLQSGKQKPIKPGEKKTRKRPIKEWQMEDGSIEPGFLEFLKQEHERLSKRTTIPTFNAWMKGRLKTAEYEGYWQDYQDRLAQQRLYEQPVSQPESHETGFVAPPPIPEEVLEMLRSRKAVA